MRQRTLAMMTGFEQYTRKTRRAIFLEEMEQVVPWRELCAQVAPHYPQPGKGRRPVGVERMLRIYFLEQWFNRSGPAVEEALYDSGGMRQFVGIDLGCEPVPDETTVCKFRHLLEAHQLGEQILGQVNLHLQAQGVRITTGTIVDATIIEPMLDPIFHPDSYGYRPGRSAKQAIAIIRKRCWQYDWVVEFDIKAAFDQIDHDLLLKAVRTHIREGWILLYIARWLTAPFETAEGEQLPRQRGTPQGGVVSPILMNLFMHYAFDIWMERIHPQCRFSRYADDAVVHCHTQEQAKEVMQSI